jgi:hypothetical protein
LTPRKARKWETGIRRWCYRATMWRASASRNRAYHVVSGAVWRRALDGRTGTRREQRAAPRAWPTVSNRALSICRDSFRVGAHSIAGPLTSAPRSWRACWGFRFDGRGL